MLATPAYLDVQAQQPRAGLAGARQVFDGAMLPGVEVNTFSHSDTLFPVKTVTRGRTVRPLEHADAALTAKVKRIHFQSQGQAVDLYDYLAFDRVAGLLVLKDGKVVLEDYELGIGPETRWISFSMAKSISSTLVAAALNQGLIASIEDPVTKYVPGLKGGVYDEVSVRNLLQMASGVKWDETYTDPNSDRRRILDLQLKGRPGSIVAYMKSLPRAGAPGTIWNYSTGGILLGGRTSGRCDTQAAGDLSLGNIVEQARNGTRCDVVGGVAGRNGSRWKRTGRDAQGLRAIRRFCAGRRRD